MVIRTVLPRNTPTSSLDALAPLTLNADTWQVERAVPRTFVSRVRAREFESPPVEQANTAA
jgi:hypothetical protein